MPSFDIVSEVDQEEVRNAVNNAIRELDTRYDFRGADASFSWSKDETTLSAESDFQLQQMLDMLRLNITKRGVDVRGMEVSDPVHSGKTFSMKVTFKQGIESLVAKKLVKMIKDSKIKVQAAIQGDQVRITAKKRDDLQKVITLARESDMDQPFQFTNFRD
ncbi:MAG: hypothetical protein ACI9Y1_001123 [Lentisphaeria bacterium]|jgi:uncharacterized protein YajQ (UPF0234 family)